MTGFGRGADGDGDGDGDLGRALLPDVDPRGVDQHAPLRVLSLTGGGFRGLFSARVLVGLCEQAGVDGPLNDRFDLFAGTSIGGLMACALAVGVAPRRVLDAIDAHGPRIFSKPPFGAVRRMVSGAIFDASALSDAVRDCLGASADQPIGEVAVGLLVPAVNWTTGQVECYMSRPLGGRLASSVSLHDVCLATSAAPTFFKPHVVDGAPMLDGGLAANNPDMVAIVEALRRWPDALDHLEVLSIGTAAARRLRLPDAADRGELGWAPRIATFMIELQESGAATQAARLLGDERYLRINAEPAAGDAAFDRMDLADDAARTALLTAGGRIARTAYAAHRPWIDRVLSGRRGRRQAPLADV